MSRDRPADLGLPPLPGPSHPGDLHTPSMDTCGGGTNAGVPTLTTPTLTPTTLRNIEQMFGEADPHEPPLHHENAAGFVPPIIRQTCPSSGNSYLPLGLPPDTSSSGPASADPLPLHLGRSRDNGDPPPPPPPPPPRLTSRPHSLQLGQLSLNNGAGGLNSEQTNVDIINKFVKAAANFNNKAAGHHPPPLPGLLQVPSSASLTFESYDKFDKSLIAGPPLVKEEQPVSPPGGEEFEEEAESPPQRRKQGGRRPASSSGVSPEEEQKRALRRERNKQAAARCRKRRLDQTLTLQEEVDQWEDKKRALNEEIEQLEREKKGLEMVLGRHRGVCKVKMQPVAKK